jgi:ABC-type dipeptide/oligopeptide/nickel transport system permease subunit
MTTTAQETSNGVVSLEQHYKGRSLWLDAFQRLSRNRAALLGGLIIIAAIIMAIFADQIAPQNYATQNLQSNNAAPQWVIEAFPSMEPRDEQHTVSPSAEVFVETGQEVGPDTLLARQERRGSVTEFFSKMSGTVVIDGNRIIVTQAPVHDYDIADWDLLVEDGQQVQVGDILATRNGGEETIVAELPTVGREVGCAVNPDTGARPPLCVGTIHIVDDTLYVRSPNFGYVIVDNSYTLGADFNGRDLLSRIIYGARVSLAVAFIGPLVSLMVGLIFGLVSGYFGGTVDTMMMRFVDVMYAFPTLLLIILLMTFFRAAFAGGETAVQLAAPIDATTTTIPVEVGLESEFRSGWVFRIDDEVMEVVGLKEGAVEVERGINDTIPAEHAANTRIAIERPKTIAYRLFRIDRAFGGMFFIFIGIGITSWMSLARLTRGQVLSVRQTEYVEAAQSIGARTPSIMWKHVLPNILGPIIVAETLTIPSYIATEAFLSFIGLGVNPPTPSWGAMISDGAETLREYPHQAVFPALALFLIMFAFNFLGDGLRDALDPRMRGSD